MKTQSICQHCQYQEHRDMLTTYCLRHLPCDVCGRIADLAIVGAPRRQAMITVTVTYEDGNTITTGINATLEEARAYYIGTAFNFGDSEEHPADKMVKAVAVDLVPESITKLNAYRQGRYEFPPPPVYCDAWEEADWIRYIDRDGRWTVAVSD